jgi:hypothetical protein
MGDKMANDTSKPSKAKQSPEEKAQAKAARREQRNKEQASEEQRAWSELHDRAEKAIEAYRAKPRFKWTPDIERELFDRISNGQSLAAIAELDHMPRPSTVYDRLQEDHLFAASYTRARENMGSVLLDQCLRIADDDSRDLLPAPTDANGNPTGDIQVNHAAIQRDKMRIDTRIRMAGKYNLRLADKPPSMDGANITVNNNTLQLDARELDGSQRDSLRQLLLAARDKAGQG